MDNSYWRRKFWHVKIWHGKFWHTCSCCFNYVMPCHNQSHAQHYTPLRRLWCLFLYLFLCTLKIFLPASRTPYKRIIASREHIYHDDTMVAHATNSRDRIKSTVKSLMLQSNLVQRQSFSMWTLVVVKHILVSLQPMRFVAVLMKLVLI